MIVIVPSSNSFRVFSFQPFVEENDGVYEIGNNLTRTEEIFHDKLENLHKYSYKLLVYAEPVKYVKRTIKLFATICEKQNATKHSTLVLIVEGKNFLALYKNAMIWRKVDLTLNSAVEVNLVGVPLQSVNTYDQKAFCAMIPLPSRTSFFELVLQPFDIFIWAFVVVSIISSAVVWALFNLRRMNNDHSIGYFIFVNFANFLGQGISFRNNRVLQVMIFQLCIMLTFILGNAYQSILITFMTYSRDGKRLKTLDKLLESDFKLKVDPIFYDTMKKSQDFPRVMQRMQPLSNEERVLDFLKYYESNTAFIMRCDVAEHKMSVKKTNPAANFYYMLPETFYNRFVKFELSDFSPYQNYFQHISDLVFESGIKEHWEVLF